MGAYELRFIVDDVTPQKSVSLRDRVAAFLRDQGVAVTHEGQAAVTSAFTVSGVDLESQEAFTEVIEATDPEAASEQARTDRKAIITEAKPV